MNPDMAPESESGSDDEIKTANSLLFKPLQIGNVRTHHRIVMPGVSRMRATQDHVPTDMMLQYYSQRAAVPGTLIITEGNIVAPEHSGYTNAPGIWNQDQIDAWKTITEEVHRKGSFMFLEVMGMGRMANPDEAKKEGFTIVGPSAIPWMDGAAVPQVMTLEDIKRTIQQFGQAAKNAIAAGFDGVELLAGNGMLIEQFLQDGTNQRDDEYGGSIDNRSRFAVDVLQSMVDAIGANRVGLRLSPWSKFLGMGMDDPVPQYSDLIKKANDLGLAFIHLIESRISGGDDVSSPNTLDFAIELWKGVVIVAGGYDGESARKLLDEKYPHRSLAVSFGRHFIANPDLVFRIKEKIPLNAYDRSLFYTLMEPKGYIDYPFSREYLAAYFTASMAE